MREFRGEDHPDLHRIQGQEKPHGLYVMVTARTRPASRSYRPYPITPPTFIDVPGAATTPCRTLGITSRSRINTGGHLETRSHPDHGRAHSRSTILLRLHPR